MKFIFFILFIIFSNSLFANQETNDEVEVINLYESKSDLDLKNIEFYVRLSFWKHAMIMEGVYIRYSMGSYGKTNENEIESFKNSTIKFANKAANKNLLEEIT